MVRSKNKIPHLNLVKNLVQDYTNMILTNSIRFEGVWVNMSVLRIANLFKLIPKKLATVTEAKGGYIEY